MKQVDLYALLPDQLFDEAKKPSAALTRLAFCPYVSEVLPNEYAELSVAEGVYYIQRIANEPIGDYGTRPVDYWYQCNDNDIVTALLKEANVL